MDFTCTQTTYSKPVDDVDGPPVCSLDTTKIHSVGIMIDAIRCNESFYPGAQTAIKMFTSSGIRVHFACTDHEDWLWLLDQSSPNRLWGKPVVYCRKPTDLGRFGLSVSLTVVYSGDDAENIEAFGGRIIYYDPHCVGEPTPGDELIGVSWIELEQFILRPRATLLTA